ncbi:hypothetical protein [Bacteroides gallinarum]|uniref:hypothetical protein n=1 Tax=Bacteroides gallinarum TaxID=376806 RepID=UPI0003A718D2|nr:hypothetical protein [Bacteroides gallinarum]
MKILIIVMGILGIFSSCTNRKENSTEEKQSILKEVKMKKDSSCFDTDTLPTDTGCSNKDNDTIGAYNKRIDIEAFYRYCNDFDNGSSFTRLPNGTLKERGKYIYSDTAFYLIDYPKDSYLCYENEYYGNGNIKSERTRIIYGDMYVGTSRYYSINGKLKEEVNEDEGYSFTIEELMHLLKKKGINIPKGAKLVNGYIDTHYKIRKHLDPEQPGYEVWYSLDPQKDSIFAMAQDSVFTISGKDGSIIDESRYILEYN